jgi:N-acetylmuramoyl-L-alanine amidase
MANFVIGPNMWRSLGRVRRLCPALLVLAGLVVAIPAHAGETVATAMRLGNHPNKTRLVIDLSNSVNFKVFTLADPYRVVVDMSAVTWRLRAAPKSTGLIAGVRYGQFKPGAARVVIDVKQPVYVKSAFLIPPTRDKTHRFVLDLAPTTRAAFMAKMTPGTAEPLAPATMTEKRGAAPAPKKRLVVIDPGHGGVDPGTLGRAGMIEKNVTLALARELRRQINQSHRYRAVLTRDSDKFIRLRDRVAIARKLNADLFISIHADAIKNRKVRGASVYTLSEKASDAEAAELADKENKADLIAGIDLSSESSEVTNILIDLAQRDTMNQSAHFAATMIGELQHVGPVLRKSHRFAGFAVLKAPDIPSVLVEVGFLSNATEARALGQADYRKKLARAMMRSVIRYFVKVEQASRN